MTREIIKRINSFNVKKYKNKYLAFKLPQDNSIEYITIDKIMDDKKEFEDKSKQ